MLPINLSINEQKNRVIYRKLCYYAQEKLSHLGAGQGIRFSAGQWMEDSKEVTWENVGEAVSLALGIFLPAGMAVEVGKEVGSLKAVNMIPSIRGHKQVTCPEPYLSFVIWTGIRSQKLRCYGKSLLEISLFYPLLLSLFSKVAGT